MLVEPTELDGVIEITPSRFSDDRGWFSETWNSKKAADAGLAFDWVQDNESFSATVGTIRGIHFQLAPHAQDKLVRAVYGRVFDVAVDLRRSSPTFGTWVGRELDADVGNQLLVPRGFGHAFMTLTADCRVAYKVTALYNAPSERSIAWNDATIDVAWPLDTAAVVLSAKDAAAPTLEAAADLFD